MAVSSIAFADEFSEKGPAQKGPGLMQKQQVERPEKPVRDGEQKEDYRERLTEIMNTFESDLLDDFTSNWADHDSIHEQLMALKEANKEDKQAQRMEVLTGIKAEIEAGNLTREDAKVMLDALKNENQAVREEIKTEIEALKALYNVDKEEVKALHEALKTAVEANDSDAVNAVLQEMLNALTDHINFDEMKYNYLASL
jgi:hypothetical protein